MVESPARVIGPLQELEPLPPESAPKKDSPLPFRVSASSPMWVLKCTETLAPLLTIVPFAVEPSAPLSVKLSRPSCTTVRPAKELLALNVRLPVPAFVTPPKPTMTASMRRSGENGPSLTVKNRREVRPNERSPAMTATRFVVDVAVTWPSNVSRPARESAAPPLSVSDAIVSSKPFRSSTPLSLIVTSDKSAIWSSRKSRTVPGAEMLIPFPTVSCLPTAVTPPMRPLFNSNLPTLIRVGPV